MPGIPEFWLTIFRNVEMLSDMVQEHDVPILKSLTDIKVEMTTQPMVSFVMNLSVKSSTISQYVYVCFNIKFLLLFHRDSNFFSISLLMNTSPTKY